MAYDTIIRGGTIATASDTFTADIGIAGGKVVALAAGLEGAKEVIDATGCTFSPAASTAMCISRSPPAPAS